MKRNSEKYVELGGRFDRAIMHLQLQLELTGFAINFFEQFVKSVVNGLCHH